MEKKGLRVLRTDLIIALSVIFLISAWACVTGRKHDSVNVDYYPEVESAVDGSTLTLQGFIDGKEICNDPDPGNADPNSCRSAVFRRCPFAYVPIRIPYCQEASDRNCITRASTPDFYNTNPTNALPFLRDTSGNPFSPGAEVSITVSIGTLESGWRTVKEIKSIEVIPGSFDPVNVNCGP
jgi:hypothetical protein